MFACSICSSIYKLEDVKHGRYFPSTGGCLICYQSMAKSDTTCFGDKKIYNPVSLPCNETCPDRRVCKVFVRHPHDSMKER